MEGPAALYAICDELAGAEAGRLLASLRASPEVKVMPHSDSPAVMNAVRRALERAGYTAGLPATILSGSFTIVPAASLI